MATLHLKSVYWSLKTEKNVNKYLSEVDIILYYFISFNSQFFF